ncbi:MAG: hypothetical protein AAGD06_14590 [Acidobacteriota bacterium]
MSLQGFQQALSELVLSPDLRERVEAEGIGALGTFDLDPREQRRVLSIVGQSGLDTGVMIHRSFRLSMLTHSLSRTCRLLGPALGELVHDYWRSNLPLHYNYVWESCRFARFLEKRWRDGELESAYLPDVVRIDRASLGLRRGLAPERVDLDPVVGGDDLAEPPRPGFLVLSCAHDPMVLLADLAAGGEVSAAPGRFRLGVHRRANGTLDFVEA